ncbi:MAG: TRAP transporter substrate-binding protein [Desulfarculus sp.]|nr:TRAP transporter substrate-binding protein [Desulfarculus sp.]
MERRDFMKKAGLGAAAVAAASVVGAPKVHAAPKAEVTWKMVTTWPPKLPYLQTGVERFAQRVEELSGGRMKIRVYAAGELVPAMGIFEAVGNGTVEAGSGAAYYWAGKSQAAQWFAAVPFGLNAQGMSAWFWGGNGLKLWEEVYAPFNLVPRPLGNTGVQMGGWFNKKIETIADFNGLKMRIPGLGGKVLAKAGVAVQLTPGGEIFTNLERGVIDATEWVGPLHDKIMGFYKVAKYYYYPGWHEPGTVLEAFFNKKAYDALPADLKAIIDVACTETYTWMLSCHDAENAAALMELIDKHNVTLLAFPQAVMDQLRVYSKEVLEEITAKDPIAKKVHDDFTNFQKQVGTWGTASEKAYHDMIAGSYPLKKG